MTAPDLRCIASPYTQHLWLMAAPVRVKIVNGVPVESRKAVAPVKPAFIEDKCMKCGKTMVPDDPALCTAPPLR